MARAKQDSWSFAGTEIEADEFTVSGADAGKVATWVGQVESALSNDTVGTTTEDGYLHFEKEDGTVIKVPYWLDD